LGGAAVQAEGICALSSARGRSGVAVIRASGRGVREAVRRLCGSLPKPRQAMLCRFAGPDGAPIDRGLALWFPAPASFSGEDVAEFHVHGSSAVVAAMLKALGALGLRLAVAGEFSRRAFENGKLDLTQISGVAELIDSETEGQRRQALQRAEGRVARALADFRERLIRVLAPVEAVIDFPDEDLPQDVLTGLAAELGALAENIRVGIARRHAAELVRDGLKVAIIGAPNAGKSSLLNALAGREAAIVSTIAGTTRDVLEVHLDVRGHRVTLADTAGLRETQDVIEREGVRRARLAAGSADLRLAVFDPFGRFDSVTADLLQPGDLVIFSRADMPGFKATIDSEVYRSLNRFNPLAVSAVSGEGLGLLQEALAARADALTAGAEGALALHLREEHALQGAVDALERARGQLQRGEAAFELAAEDIRLALHALAQVAGRVDVEEVLDLIFSSFCIGK